MLKWKKFTYRVQSDCSQRGGEERLSLFLSGWHWASDAPVQRQIWSGVITSKEAAAQLYPVMERMRQLAVIPKLASAGGDQGTDVFGHVSGLYARIDADIKRVLFKVKGDLHVLNRLFVVASQWVFGAAKQDIPNALQLLYLVSYALQPWKKWHDLLMAHCPAGSWRRPQRLCMHESIYL